MKHALLILVLGLNLMLVAAQSSKHARNVVLPDRISSPVPIVFGTHQDGLPDTMLLQGTIVDLTFAEVGCGYIAWSGTLQVRQSQPIAGYPHQDVFIVLSCFPEFEKFKNNRDLYINQPISLTVSKLYPEFRFGAIKDIKKVPCAYELIVNNLDSKKVPFYCTQESISESIEATQNKKREKQ